VNRVVCLVLATQLYSCKPQTQWKVAECRQIKNCFYREESFITKQLCNANIGYLIQTDGLKGRACMSLRK
jgi:hypothetical protein